MKQIKSKDLAFISYLARLSARIEVRRETLGMTQGELAKMCDLTQSSISRIECGDSAASIETFFKISVALKIDLSALMRA